VTRPVLVDLGVDLGTTVTKVVALREDGSVAAEASAPTAWEEPGDGRAQCEPGVVVGAVEGLVARVATTVVDGRPLEIRSVGFTSMAEAGVLVDADDRTRSPVIAWFDPRGARQAAALEPELAAELPGRTGLYLSHVPSLFKLAWLRDEGLDLRGLQWLSLPELVILRLGGRRVAELSLLGRTGLLDVHTGGAYPRALRHLGVDERLLPDIVGAGTPAGRVRPDHPVAAVRGAVLTVAGHDHAVAAAAAGSAATASAMDSVGTAEAFLVASAHLPGPEVVADLTAHGVTVHPHVVHGTTGLLAGMRTGLVLKRVLRMLDADDDAGRRRLEEQATADLTGHHDIEVSGFAMRDHDVVVTVRGDSPSPGLLWRTAVDRSTEHAAGLLAQLGSSGIPIERLVLAGGWSRMPSIVAARRTLARSVEVSDVAQPGLRGAALFGRWAALHADPTASDQRPPAHYFGSPTAGATRSADHHE
jgi:sugar (pentulose or hexulose) kinase